MRIWLHAISIQENDAAFDSSQIFSTYFQIYPKIKLANCFYLKLFSSKVVKRRKKSTQN